MSEYLLIVREALSTEHFENCEFVSHRSHWPSMVELQRVSAQHSCPFVAFTGSADADSVQRMVKLLGDLASSERRLLPDVLKSAVAAALPDVKLSSAERKCITSGVLLLWDFLHESHEISQTMEGRGTPRTADYWQAIMHRREPDAGNASYWFRRVGSHPAFDRLQANLENWMVETGASDEERRLARQTFLRNGQFDPFAMIELSTQALRKPGQLEDRTLRRAQYFEILNLLAWSMGTVSSIG